MSNFEYVAWDAQGVQQDGLKQAHSEEDVLSWLREQNLTPVHVGPIVVGKMKKKKIRFKRVKAIDLSNFCWQLSTMVEGGLPITSAIETIAEDIENKYFGDALEKVAEGLQQGSPLAEAIGRFSRIFNALACAMIQAGEESGSLVSALQRLATYYENRDKIVRKVKAAIYYPIFVVGFVIVIVIVMMTLIIPRFRSIFESMGGDLPAFTKAFMAVYDLIMNNFILGSVLILVAVAGVVFYNRTKKGHERLSKVALSIPLLGKVLVEAFLAIFCRTLGTLLSSGIPILDAFDILANMTKNDVLKHAITSTRERVVQGSAISLSMAASNFFPNVMVKMTQVGEESGSLPDVLDKTADYYEKRVDSLVTAMLTLLEPVLIITVGAIVLVIVLAMYLPIFYLSDVQG